MGGIGWVECRRPVGGEVERGDVGGGGEQVREERSECDRCEGIKGHGRKERNSGGLVRKG